MCPDNTSCEWWIRPENGTTEQCMKPRCLFCPADSKQDEKDDDDDGVKELRF